MYLFSRFHALMFLGVLGVTQCGYASVTVVPQDSNVLACVRTRLGIGSDVQPTLAQLESITSLGCQSDKPIGNAGVQELGSLSNLTYLYFYGDDMLTEIKPLANLSKLEGLGVSGSYSKRVSVQSLSPLSSLVNLKSLQMPFAQVSDVSALANFGKLAYLDLRYNQVSDIGSMSGLVGLQELKLDNNKISSVAALSALANLQTLELNENQVVNISPLSGLGKLKSLQLYANKVEDISPLSSLGELKNLGLSSNKFSDISPLANLIKLEVLYLYGNNIVDISPLSSIASLQSIQVANNQLVTIPSLSNLVNLQYLGLANNKISDISALVNIARLQQLDLFGNSIVDISPISTLNALKTLNLQNNHIVDISPLSNLVKLQNLDFYSNQVTDISSLIGLKDSLKFLRISANQVKDVSPLSGFINLEYLSAGSNGIVDISFISSLSNLYSLELYSNQIADIKPLSSLVKLQYANMSYNNIIDVSSLAGVRNSLSLNLYANCVTDVSKLPANITVSLGGQKPIEQCSATDTIPDPFSFSDKTDAGIAVMVESNPITVKGINVTAPVSVNNGEYRINGGEYQTAAGVVKQGDSVQLRHVSAAKEMSSVSTTLNIGGLSGKFTSTTAKVDTSPDAFSFAAKEGVDLSSWVESDPVLVSGINMPTAITVKGGEYRLNGGAYTSAAGTASNGDQVQVRHTSSAKSLSSVSTTLEMGGVSGSFSSKTAKADTLPDPISLTSKTGVALSSPVESDPITITGINAPTPVSITGGEYRLNGGAYTTVAGVLANGDTVQVRHKAASVSGGVTNSNLKVGTAFATFKSTALSVDTVPDRFTLDSQTGVPRSTLVESNSITVSGINAPVAISVTGGEYRVNGGTYTAAAGMVNPGDTVQVRHMSSAKGKGMVMTNLKVGMVFATFKTSAQ